MKIETKFHQEVEITPEQILTFNQGIPGFEEETKFILIDLFEGAPYKVLQSVKTVYVAFVMCDPWMFISDYEFDLKSSTIQQLQVEQPQDLEVYTLMTLAEEFSKSTINLLAPIVIHQKQKIGMQVVLEPTNYTTKHPIRIEG